MKQYSYFKDHTGDFIVIFTHEDGRTVTITSEETDGRAESAVKALNDLLEWQEYDFGIEILSEIQNKTGKPFSEQDIQESIGTPAEAFADEILKQQHTD